MKDQRDIDQQIRPNIQSVWASVRLGREASRPVVQLCERDSATKG